MFLFIDNYDSFSYNLVQAFYDLGKNPVVYTNDDPRILELASDPDLTAVCISPGPSHPKNAGLCLEFLKRLPAHIPVLGVCLGHQLLGYFAGAQVSRAPHVFHGKSSDIMHSGTGLFQGLANPMTIGRYHSLVVQTKENDSNPMFTVTARGPEGEVMALRYNDRPWAGIQFHPESILTPQGAALLANFPDNILPGAQKEKRITRVLETLASGQDLSAESAAAGFADLMDGRMSPAQAGAFLMGLRAKGETPVEMAQAVNTALARANKIPNLTGECIDVVGTGGDGRNSFNCSTATALTLAGMGYRVVKHGNRAISSTCGAADALEGLGCPLDTPVEQVAEVLARRNFTFLFAPHYHPSFKNVGPIRRELGVRTLFNLLGPLINPARPSHMLLGVAKPELLDLIARTLQHSQVKKAAIVCGAGGYDELTPMGESQVIILDQGTLTQMTVNPADYGIAPCSPTDVAVHSKEEAIAVLRQILAGHGPQAMMDMLTLNVGMALFILRQGVNLATCMADAKAAVAAGVGRGVIHAVE